MKRKLKHDQITRVASARREPEQTTGPAASKSSANKAGTRSISVTEATSDDGEGGDRVEVRHGGSDKDAAAEQPVEETLLDEEFPPGSDAYIDQPRLARLIARAAIPSTYLLTTVIGYIIGRVDGAW
jgi:hypothetical protein